MFHASDKTARSRRIGIAAVALALPLFALACGSPEQQVASDSDARQGAQNDTQSDSESSTDSSPVSTSDGTDAEFCALLTEASAGADISDPGASIAVFEQIEAVAPSVIAQHVAVVREAYEVLAADPSADLETVFGPEQVEAGMMLVAWESDMCENDLVEISSGDIDAAEAAAGNAAWVDQVAGTSIVNGRASVSLWGDATTAEAVAACDAISAQVPGGDVSIWIDADQVARSTGDEGCSAS